MRFSNRLLRVGLLSVGITAATTARAGNQLFTGSWTVKALGNERTGGVGSSAVYSVRAIPQGIQCNPNYPRCPFDSTPTDGHGNFNPRGGFGVGAPYCVPWYNFQGMKRTARPAKDATATTGSGRLIPPLYRNPVFFTPSGQPGTTFCTATSTDGAGGKGLVQAGQPVTGTWGAVTTGIPGKGGFSFAAAPAVLHPAGIRTTGQIGDFRAYFPYPYLYTYSYATLRNDRGVFGPGKGPGDFTIDYHQTYFSGIDYSAIKVKQGAAKFGGTMKMLGALTAKRCYYFPGGCSRGENNWRYDAVGAAAITAGGVVIGGYIATYKAYYYQSFETLPYPVSVVGSRFPWTTGRVTVKAIQRTPFYAPRRTILHYAQGYDNRNTTTPSGKGMIQLVTPVLTRWIFPVHGVAFPTVGVGILRLKFVPEPQMWAMLVAGVSLLGVGYWIRGRRA